MGLLSRNSTIFSNGNDSLCHYYSINITEDKESKKAENTSNAIVAKQPSILPTNFVQPSHYESVCSNVTIRTDECKSLSSKERSDNHMFPIHFVSGVPGSGNEWILWLASLSRKY